MRLPIRIQPLQIKHIQRVLCIDDTEEPAPTAEDEMADFGRDGEVPFEVHSWGAEDEEAALLSSYGEEGLDGV